MISRVRTASRMMVRELGLMNRTLFGDALSLSAVHAIIEVGAQKPITAQDLSERLVLEKSTVSRLLGSLVDKGFVVQNSSSSDRRRRLLTLTEPGEKVSRRIQSLAEDQVRRALQRSPTHRQNLITAGLEAYSEALRSDRFSEPESKLCDSLTLHEGYKPGLLAVLLSLQIDYYSQINGFGAVFETTVASGLADFLPRLDHPMNAMWRAEIDGCVVGSISIDGQDLESTPNLKRGHLRWFIVDPNYHGHGIGKMLVKQAMAFCDSVPFDEVHLSTIRGLDTARALYERHGFNLIEEHEGITWGQSEHEQVFVRKRLPLL